VNAFTAEIRELIRAACQAVAHSVDLIQVDTNFEIVRRIVEHEQQCSERVEYGKQTIKELATDLFTEFGKGISERNLRSMRKYYLLYTERFTGNFLMASGQFSPDKKNRMPFGEVAYGGDYFAIWQMASARLASPFLSSWSQYVFLIYVERKIKEWIEKACLLKEASE